MRGRVGARRSVGAVIVDVSEEREQLVAPGLRVGAAHFDELAAKLAVEEQVAREVGGGVAPALRWSRGQSQELSSFRERRPLPSLEAGGQEGHQEQQEER